MARYDEEFDEPTAGLDAEPDIGIESVPLLDMRHDHGEADPEVDDVEGQRGIRQFTSSSENKNSKRRKGSNRMGSTGGLLGFAVCGNGQKIRGLYGRGRSPPYRMIGYWLAIVLMIMGVVQLVALTSILFGAIFPDQAAYFRDHVGDPSKASEGLLHWPTDFSRDVQPVPCHSHNDYWRRYPLYSAIQAGCTGVEADVWPVDGELFVGHSRASLASNRTLKNLYVDPLMEILGRQNPVTDLHPKLDVPLNGVFDTAPQQTLVLMIDFKTDGAELWPFVHSQLEPLRTAGYLTFVNGTKLMPGPVTVVATGFAPFDLLLSSKSRDIFFDAPLASMAVDKTEITPRGHEASVDGSSSDSTSGLFTYNETNSFYASVNFASAIGSIWSEPSDDQLNLIRSQIRGAHNRGLKARYWNTPSWPRGLRNRIWNILVREGADYLNVDDLRDATEGNWGEW